MKNIKIILLLGLVIIALFLLGYGRIGGGEVFGGQSRGISLSASETLYDFGTISMKNGDVTKEFVVANPLSEDIKVETMVTSCMCTRAYMVLQDGEVKGPFGMPGMGYVPPANEVIEAGGTRVIRVVYDPNAHGPAGVGRIDRFVTLTSDKGETLKLEIRALVTP